ncbi:MAG: hypothetical protein CML99_07225 [Rhodobiaceae bacterium]|mgnify:CR=1 FL=1|nr:hypothetical protein [Rhodobiaceae bacterium]|tara:strand:- start:2300 stop:2644 length:345 start_codon:yes stop_codon:yes gene_type:complete
MSDSPKRNSAQTIALLNDKFRKSFNGGTVYITSSVQAFGSEFVEQVLGAVRAYNAFAECDDLHQEHDFGSLTILGQQVFWKIDCYDSSEKYQSCDPGNLEETQRVLTVMLPSDY